MPRALWKGAIAFGLVHVPVALYAASQEDNIDFDWLDRRSMDPVGYQRINKRTGKPISKEDIVKGVKQDDGRYVLVDDDEVRDAYPRTTQTIEIEAFAKVEEIPVAYFEKPYFLEPTAKSDKVYALLRETMAEHGVIGIARVVLHTKEHLAALMPVGNALVLNTLRWASELRPAEGLALPAASKAQAGIKESELRMAGQLVDELTVPWNAADYHDRFVEAIRKLIETKVEAGEARHVTPIEDAGEGARPSNVVDLAALLRQSLGRRPRASSGADDEAEGEAPAPRRTGARAKAAPKAAPKAAHKAAAKAPAARKRA
ncbi:MAG TPA: Ku protein [Burkholderiaceae bacterium]